MPASALPDVSAVGTENDWSGQLLCLRLGLGTVREHTLEEVGARWSSTRERIRQIERSALAKLRARRDAMRSLIALRRGAEGLRGIADAGATSGLLAGPCPRPLDEDNQATTAGRLELRDSAVESMAFLLVQA
jgi:hypothetical protein